jgi:hypothetical protein
MQLELKISITVAIIFYLNTLIVKVIHVSTHKSKPKPVKDIDQVAITLVEEIKLYQKELSGDRTNTLFKNRLGNCQLKLNNRRKILQNSKTLNRYS